MEQKLKSIVASVLGIPEDTINGDSSMDTIEVWDSLKHIDIVVSIEEEFEIPQFTADEIPEITSVDKIKLALRARGVEI